MVQRSEAWTDFFLTEIVYSWAYQWHLCMYTKHKVQITQKTKNEMDWNYRMKYLKKKKK